MRFGLSEEEWQTLHSLCIKPLKRLDSQLWIFGSRSRGDHKDSSDIDLLYETKEPLRLSVIGQIESDLEESRLPYKVDLVDIKNLADSYKENVLSERVKL